MMAQDIDGLVIIQRRKRGRKTVESMHKNPISLTPAEHRSLLAVGIPPTDFIVGGRLQDDTANSVGRSNAVRGVPVVYVGSRFSKAVDINGFLAAVQYAEL
jgi:hypothetical protein